MQTTGNLGLKKPDGTDVVDISVLNSNMDKLDAEVIKAASPTVDGRMTAADKTKLNGIAAGANNYAHPAAHPATMITEDATHRFATDAEKTAWNAKASTTAATASAAGLMSAADKGKLDGVAAGANNYTHPATHPPAMIAQDANNRFVTDAEKTTWNAKETPSGAQAKANQAEVNAKNASLPRSGGEINGSVRTIANGGNGLQLVGLDHCFLPFYPLGIGVGRKAYAGFSGGNSTDFTIHNEDNGYITLVASKGLSVNGTVVLDEINNLKQSGVDAKNGVVASLNAMGVSATTGDTWATAAAKIRQISTGKKYAMGTLVTSNTIRGLGFRPRTIVLYSRASDGNDYGAAYSEDVNLRLSHLFNTYTSGGQCEYQAFGIYDDGFYAPVGLGYAYAAFS